MDIKKNIFALASNGDLSTLKRILQPLQGNDLRVAVSFKLNGTTPLLMAIRNGHCEVVHYFIEQCEVEVEQVGKVTVDGEEINNAPPLWCAAAVGCIKCVHMLVDHGAKVNNSTSTSSTPLRAACFDGHFEIVKYLVAKGADIEIANQHGHTCLMITCFKRHYQIAEFLIEKGANVNRQSVKGNTAMHDCAEANSMDILKLLIKHGGVFLRDSTGQTPLMTAALAGNKEMADYMKSVFEITLEEDVDCDKLLGATYVDKFFDLSGAYDYWRVAIQKSINCSKEYHASLHRRHEHYEEAYGDAKECTAHEELTEIYSDPDLMKMQSLIIRERILGIHHPETYYFIRYRGAAYADSGDYARCISLWLYNLERQQDAYKPMSDMTQNSFISIIELFAFMFSRCTERLRACDIFRVMKLAINELLTSSHYTSAPGRMKLYRLMEPKLMSRHQLPIFNGEITGLDRQLLIVIQLIGFMCQMRTRMTVQEWIAFKRSIYELIALDPRSSCSYSLLHILCLITKNELVSSVKIPVAEIFWLVVEVSRDLNVIDIYGNTPLHLLFLQKQPKTMMINTLLMRGAHLDLCNGQELTPYDYVEKAGQYRIRFLTLKCLCAHVAGKNKLPLDGLPDDLQQFVKLHQKRGIYQQ